MPNAVLDDAPPCAHATLQVNRPTVHEVGPLHGVRQVAKCLECGTWLLRFSELQPLSEWMPNPQQSPRRRVG